MSAVDGLAEAAIASAYNFANECARHVGKRGAYKSYDSNVIQTANNLEALIAACPDSDILRAEAMAFTFIRLADSIEDGRTGIMPDPALRARAEQAMRQVRRRPAYAALAQQYPALYA